MDFSTQIRVPQGTTALIRIRTHVPEMVGVFHSPKEKLSLPTNFESELKQLDLKIMFFQSKLEGNIYMKLPSCFLGECKEYHIYKTLERLYMG